MITIIFGAPGAGKSSLNTFFLKQTYELQGRSLLLKSVERINQLNKNRKNQLSVPEKAPIFADYKVKFKVGYNKTFEPYFVNAFYLGLVNDRMETQYLPPFSKVFLGEAQRYYNSRKSSTFPDNVSRFFEMHRHYGYDIYLDVQRVMLIDSNIRDLCKHFIEVQGMEHETDDMGRTVRTTFKCREFTNWIDVNDYLTTGAASYTQTSYINNGDIFSCFDSFNFFETFLPDESKDFNLLPFLSPAEQKSVSDEEQIFYNRQEPAEFRSVPKKETNKK